MNFFAGINNIGKKNPLHDSKGLRRYLLPTVIIIFGVLVSFATFHFTSKWVYQKIRQDFEHVSENRYSALQREIESGLAVVAAIKAFYGVDQEVNRAEFGKFATAFLAKHPSIQALEWIPRVPDSRREAYEKKAREDGLPNFQISERVTQGKMKRADRRAEYFPIYFVEPYKGNEIALGFDLASNQVRKEALEQSRDSGAALATAKIRLVQETADQFGFLVFEPVYRWGAAVDSSRTRHENLQGFTLGVFSIGGIMEKSLSYLNPEWVDINLYDISSDAKGDFLSYHPSLLRGKKIYNTARDVSASAFEFVKTIDVAGRKWQFRCRALPEFVATRRTLLPWGVLTGGLLITYLLADYLLAGIRRAERIECLVNERTLELRNANEMLTQEVSLCTKVEEELQEACNGLEMKVRERTRELEDTIELLRSEVCERLQVKEALLQSEDRFRNVFETGPIGIALMDLDCRFVKVNPMLCRMTGYTEKELLALTYMSLTPPGSVESDVQELQRLLQGSISDFKMDRRFFKKNRELIWVALTTSVVPDDAGNPLYLLGMLLDITERKQREREQEIILSMTTALRKAGTSSELMRIALEQLAGLLNFQGAAIALRNNEDGEMLVEYAVGCWADWKGKCISGDDLVSRYVSEDGQVFSLSDPQNNSPCDEVIVPAGIHSMVCIPLVAQQQTIGSLTAGYEIPLTNHDAQILEAIGDIIANAVHRAMLHEQTVRQIQRLSALSAIDTAINASVDLRVTFRIILDEVVHQLCVDAAAVLLLNRRTQTLEYAAGEGFRSAFPQGVHLRVGVGHAGRAALERRIVSVPNLSQGTEGYTIPLVLADEGFVSYLAVPLIVKGEVRGVLEVFQRSPLVVEREWLDFLNNLAGQTAIAIGDTELFNDLQRSNTELILAYDATIEGWSRALDMRDEETEGHSRRVTEITLELSRRMGMSEEELVHVRRGALLHDIGKMGIPDNILLKPGPLTTEEWVIMRKHPVFAREMLSSIAFLKPALEIPCFHHEKWDGTGYPQGLQGEEIPLAARIFSVVDVWDALISDRPYRKAWSEEKAADCLREQSGTAFDPKVLEMFLSDRNSLIS